MNTQQVNIFWFRRDLRLEDNVGLFHALSAKQPVLPVFIFDTAILDKLNDKADLRVDFIHQQLTAIQSKLRTFNSDLLVLHGEVTAVWQKLVNKYQISEVYFNHDYEPAAIERDESIKHLLDPGKIQVHSYKDQVLFEKSEIVKADGSPYTVYTPYSKKWRERLDSSGLHFFPSEKLTGNFVKADLADMPSIDALGFRQGSYTFPSPEPPISIIDQYDRHRDYPGRPGTTRLGLHLRFGTISIRHMARLALEHNDTWLSELIWREFFMMILYHFPHVVNQPFRSKYAAIKWRNDPEDFDKWCEGRTGYPLVDAGMRELNQTGFMHNRVRMVTASFLTKHLLIDWRLGERYFAGKLLDYDLAANNGNWQWAAGCGCDAAPYFRIFNPTAQAQKFDPEEKYIRQWIPELDSSEYPRPMVEHSFARQRALQTFSEALR